MFEAASVAPAKDGKAVPIKTGAEKALGGDDEKYKQWCDHFGKKALNDITKKWNTQMIKNKDKFDQSASTLQDYELKLIQQIKAIEGIERQSNQMMEVYADNFRDINAVR